MPRRKKDKRKTNSGIGTNGRRGGASAGPFHGWDETRTGADERLRGTPAENTVATPLPGLKSITVASQVALEVYRRQQFKKAFTLTEPERSCLASAYAKRHAHGAYVLALGTSGSGKTSLMNQFLGEEVAPTSNSKSKTEDVVEYTLRLEEVAICAKDLELSFIDTPGFFDTKGVIQDVNNSATILQYLQERGFNEKVFPNLVLFLHKSNDNRFDGENAILEGAVDHLTSLKVVDTQQPNLVLLVTHAYSKRSPEAFQEIVEKAKAWSCIMATKLEMCPEDIVIEYVETDVRETVAETVYEEGTACYKLPNGSSQPCDLFKALRQRLKDNKDMLGFYALQAAFQRGAATPLVHSETKRVKYHQAEDLARAQAEEFKRDTEFLKNKLNPMMALIKQRGSLTQEHAEALARALLKAKVEPTEPGLKTFLATTYIQLCEKLEVHTSSHLSLMSSQDVLAWLSEQGLPPMRTTTISRDDCVAGRLFNAKTGAEQQSKTLFLFGQHEDLPNALLPTVPKGMVLKVVTREDCYCEFVEDVSSYRRQHLSKMGVEASFTGAPGYFDAGFTVDGSLGYNTTKSTTEGQVQALYELSFFTVRLDFDEVKLKGTFVDDVLKLPEMCTNAGEEAKFSKFFEEWGTHYFLEGCLGGYISCKETMENCEDNKINISDASAKIQAKLHTIASASASSSTSGENEDGATRGASRSALSFHGGAAVEQDAQLWRQSLYKGEGLLPLTYNRRLGFIGDLGDRVSLPPTKKEALKLRFSAMRSAMKLILAGSSGSSATLAPQITTPKADLENATRKPVKENARPKAGQKQPNTDNSTSKKESGGCFPGCSWVIAKEKGLLRLSEVAVGDRVLAAHGCSKGAHYCKVLVCGEHEMESPASVLTVCMKSGHQLALTDNHYLPVLTDGGVGEGSSRLYACRASTLEPGTKVVVVGVDKEGGGPPIPLSRVDMHVSEVVSITRAPTKTLFYLYTECGSVFVDNVLASCHADTPLLLRVFGQENMVLCLQSLVMVLRFLLWVAPRMATLLLATTIKWLKDS